MKLNRHYLIAASMLITIEITIARCLNDRVIRPFGGDFLVVILIYCAVKSFFDIAVWKAAAGVLLFAYLVEVSQYFHLVSLLGWQHNSTAVLLFGTTFSFPDLVMYTLGSAVTIAFEYTLNRRHHEIICS